MTVAEIGARQAEVRATIDRLAEQRATAAAGLEALAPQIEEARRALGASALDARLGQGKKAAAGINADALVALERDMAEHTAVIVEADHRLAVARAEDVRLERQAKTRTYRDALIVRDRQLQIVQAKIAELAPALAELWRLENVAYGAGQNAGVGGHPHGFRNRIRETLTHMLGEERVPPGRRWDLAEITGQQAARAEAAVQEGAAA